MTFGVNNVINCINQSATRTDLTSLELLQLTGSECQFNDKCAVYSVACQASLPTASCNTGRFVYVADECKYYFSNGSVWTDNVSGIVSSAWSWGVGSDGKLGDNSTVAKISPVSVVGGFTDWLQVSAGTVHSLGLRSNGTARAWGSNAQGQLGDNSITNRSSPVSVAGGFCDWCQVSAGGGVTSGFSLGVRTNGSAWAWGAATDGRLGDCSTVSKSSPVSVVGGFTDWCQVSAGGGHSLGVRTNGTAWAWGCNIIGQLGDDSVASQSSPVSVVGGFCDWCQLSGGSQHSLGVRTNGTAWAWGCNNTGQLGDDTVTSRSSPVSVVGGFCDWCQLSGGLQHSLGVKQDGTLWAWGINTCGQLGDNTTVSKRSPVSVVGGFTDWYKASAGGGFSLAIRTNGTAWAWGCGANGRLGDGSTVSKSSPVSVVGGYTDWWDISAGRDFSLAIRKSCGF